MCVVCRHAALLLITAGGVVVGRIEGWNLRDSVYFALVTAMTIATATSRPRPS
jgi:hypothetical protein